MRPVGPALAFATLAALASAVASVSGLEPPRPAPAAAAASPADPALAHGMALLAQNRVAEAQADFERALVLDPSSADARYMIGWMREQAKDYEGAAADYESALAAPRGERRSTTASASCCGQQGRTDEGVAEFRQAVGLDPRLFDARYHLGATLWWTGEAAAALPELEAAVRLRPEHPEARYYLALSPEAAGRPPARGGAAPSRDRSEPVPAARPRAARGGAARVGRPRRARWPCSAGRWRSTPRPARLVTPSASP